MEGFRIIVHFPHHYEIGNFRRSISISHTVRGRFSRHAEMADTDKVINPQHLGNDLTARHLDPNSD